MVVHGEGLALERPTGCSPGAGALGGWTGAPAAVPAGNPFRAGRDAREPWAAAIQQLSTLNRLAGVVIYGSPYLWESLQAVLPNGCPAAYSAGQMQEAQRQVLTTLFPTASPASGGGAFTD